MNIILLGPQGSGKGTQAQLLVERNGFIHLEMGKILRGISKSSSKYAEIVKDALLKGELIPNEYANQIAWDFINEHDPKNGNFLLEGYPRTSEQYEEVKEMFRKLGKDIDAVVDIEISEEETVRRLSARRTCEECGEVYNLITNPPTEEGKCEKCRGHLTQREDDLPEAIKRRLEIYRSQTRPMFEKAKGEGVGIEVDGEKPIEEVYAEIVNKLEL